MTFRKSLLLAVAYFFLFIFWKAVEKLLGMHENNIHLYPVFSDLILIPIVVIYISGMRNFRIGMGGKVSYLNALGFGLMTTLFIVIFTPMSVWIFDQFINPNFYASMIQYQVQQKLSSLQIAQQSFNHENFKESMIIGNIVTGAILSAIIAFFSAKKSI